MPTLELILLTILIFTEGFQMFFFFVLVSYFFVTYKNVQLCYLKIFFPPLVLLLFKMSVFSQDINCSWFVTYGIVLIFLI